MKRTVKISLFAMLVAAPVMANAATKLTPVTITQPSQTMATTTYVQGAFNAIATPVNAIIDETTVPTLQPGQTYTAIGSTNTVSENLVALDNAIKDAATTSGDTYVTKTSAAVVAPEGDELHYLSETAAGTNVGENLGILDSQVYTNTVNIGNVSAMGTEAETVAGAIAEMHAQTISITTMWGQESTTTSNIRLFPQKP